MRKWIAPLLVVVLVLSFAAPAFAKAKAKPVKVTHPYTAKYRNKVAVDFKTWGYIRPRISSSTDSTLTIAVAKWEGKRSWVTSSGLEADAALYPAKKFKKATKYRATMNISQAGWYRMRAVYQYEDAKGTPRTKRSSWKYVRIVK